MLLYLPPNAQADESAFPIGCFVCLFCCFLLFFPHCYGLGGQNWIMLVSPYRGETQHVKFQPPHSTPKLSKSSHFLLTTHGCNQVIHQPSLRGASVINSMYFSIRSTKMVNSNKTFIFMSLCWHVVFMPALYEYQRGYNRIIQATGNLYM